MTSIEEVEREGAGPMPAPKLPLPSRIRIFIITWAFKPLVKVVFGPIAASNLHHPRNTQPSSRPTQSSHDSQTASSFLRSRSNDDPLPLYIDIHLGGFIIGELWWDDAFCAHFCNTYNILVVSLDYSKAPSAKFPVPVNDIISLVQAVLSDDSLPIDKNRVVIGGFSAGSNLALAAVQAPEIRGNKHGVVCWCRITEWVTPIHTKL